MGEVLKNRWVRAAAVLALLVGAYAWLGFRVAPGLVRQQAIDLVRERYGRELQVGELRLQPFKLQLEVRDLAFPDRDRQPMLALRRLFVDFELASLWRGAWVFRELDLEGPAVRAVLRRDGTLNLADLAGSAGPAPSATSSDAKSLPSLWIESLAIRDGRAEYLELARRRAPFAREFAPVGFTLRDFRTTPEGGAFRLAARSGAGESFEWNGRFALAPRLASEGEFRIAGLQAPGLAEFLGEALPFDVASGTIELGGHYRLSLGASTELEASLPRLTLADAALRARGVSEDWIRVPSLVVEDTTLRLPAQQVHVKRVAVQRLQGQAWLEADGTVNLQRLFAPPASAESATPVDSPATEADAAASRAAAPVRADATTATSRPWSFELDRLDLRDAAFDVEDRRGPQRPAFRFAPVNLGVEHASLDLGRPLPVSLDALVNDHARLTVAGSITPSPLAAKLEVALDRARMQILQPFVLPVADLTIRSGLLGVRGKVQLATPAAGMPRLVFDGDAAIDDFASIDNALRQDLVSFRRLELQKLRYTLQPDALRIDRIRLAAPYARVVISAEEVLNLAAVLDPQGTAAQLATRRAVAAARAAETRAQRRDRERREKQQARQREQAARRAARRAAAAPAAAEVAVERGLPIRIRELRIDAGRMSFSDLNVRPNFAAEIVALDGAVTGLSTAPDSRAQVGLKGRVDEFSPVTIDGAIQPFAFDRYTDVALKFENISLPVFNPYSGRFAGYNIAKGKLTTDLRYQIDRRKLKAEHRIRIDQLEWGEASANKGEATLPVKFATALLKDRNGVIQLDVPVTGTLDDPKLRIGPIVWQVIKNLIVKAVTAPFALLGALFAGAEDAQFVDFAPGSAALDAATAERLAAVAKGLAEKPGISIDVPIGADAALDRPALAERAFLAQRDAALGQVLRRAADDATPLPAFESLPPRQRLATLRAVLTAQGGTLPKFEAPAAPDGASRAEARAQAEVAELEFYERNARQRSSVADDALPALARERATNIQRALLAAGLLEPARVFLVNEGKVAGRDGRVRLELGLK